MAKKKTGHRPPPQQCCDKLAQQLGIEKNNCFTENAPSGSEGGTGMKVVFKEEAQPGICRLDLRCHFKQAQHTQCDFLFYRCATKEMHFVELKKTADWDDAFGQIKRSITKLEQKASGKFEKKKIKGYIVHHNTPPRASQTIRTMENEFVQKLGYKSFKTERNGKQIKID